MYVVASFKLNKNLERAIAELEYIGIIRKKILALPLVTEFEQDLHVTYRKKLFEIAPILGTIFTLFGAIYGFVLYGGPIFWGLIGVGLGLSIGIVIDLVRTRNSRKKGRNEDGKLSEVFLLVHCSNEGQVEKVKELIWKWSPLGVSTFCK